MYRPRSRSPPRQGYRSNRYSPSREVTPERGYDYRDRDRPMHREHYSPPRAVRYDEHPPSGRPRYDSPPRRYQDERREDSYYRRRDSPPRGERYLERGSPPRMMADREPPRRPQAPRDITQWETGRDQDELAYSNYGHPHDAAPTNEVVFRGVDDDLDDEDLVAYMRTSHDVAVRARIVRKQHAPTIAFVTFASLPDAERFMRTNAPAVVMPALYEGQTEGRTVRIEYDHHVPSGTPDVRQKNGQVPHDGMRDVGTPQNNRVLLLRQVDPSASASMVLDRVAREIASFMNRPNDVYLAKECVARIVSISDMAAGWSWGIFFIELATPALASAMLQHLTNPASQPSGFRIANVPAAVSFAAASFTPVDAGLLGGEHLVPPGKAGGIGNTEKWSAYWHPQGSATQHASRWPYEPAPHVLAFLGHFGIEHAPPTAPTKQKKRKEQDMMVPLEIPVEVKPTTQEEDRDTVLRSRTAGQMIITPQSGRKTANNINKWNTKLVELAKPVKPITANAVPIAEKEFDFTDASTLADTGKCACLLCQRQFPSEDKLAKHVAKSDLHKARFILTSFMHPLPFPLPLLHTYTWPIQTNLADPDTVEAGKKRKATASAAYRDRAAERRKAFNQPDKPSWHELHKADNRRFAAPSAPVEPVAAPAPPPGQDHSNVGNQLLSKMGYQAGTGLGVGGEGRVEPIKVQQFAERAGLGSGVGIQVGEGRAQTGKQMAQARYHAS